MFVRFYCHYMLTIMIVYTRRLTLAEFANCLPQIGFRSLDIDSTALEAAILVEISQESGCARVPVGDARDSVQFH